MTESPLTQDPDDEDISRIDIDGLAALDRLCEEFETALQSDPDLTPEAFAARHPDVSATELVPALRGLVALTRTRRRTEGPFSKGDRVGPYRVSGELGRGGMGVVYEAVEDDLGRVVAIKALNAAGVDDRFRARFAREARAAARLDHPAIVPVFGSGESEGVLWYAMRRIEGVPLDRCLSDLAENQSDGVRRAALAHLEGSASSGSRVSGTAVTGLSARVRAAATIAMRLADALAYAHAEGVLHRDVKPGNVMLDRDGAPLLTDFGLCKVEGDASLTADTDLVGTLRYMPPEALEGKADARGDVYGLGLVLHELVTGAPAYVADDQRSMLHRILHVDPPPLRKSVPNVPEDLERIVAKATSKLPEERYASASDLAEDLSALLTGKPVQARAPSALYLAKLFVRRNRALAVTLAVAVVLFAVGATQYVVGLREAFDDVSAARDLAEERAAQANLATAEANLRTFDTAGASAAVEAVPEAHRDWMWDHVAARVGRDVPELPTEATDLAFLAASPDGSRVAEYGRYGVTVRRREGLEIEASMDRSVLDAAFTGDGEALVMLMRAPREIVRWDFAAGTEPEVIREAGRSAGRLFTLPGASFGVLAVGFQRLVGVDLITGEELWNQQFGVPRISIAAPLSETEVVFGTTGGNVYLFDAEARSVDEMRHHPGYVRSFLVENGELAASGSDDGTVVLYPSLTGHAFGRVKLDGGAHEFARDPNDDRMLAVATQANTVALIDVRECIVRRSLTGIQTRPEGLHFGASPWLAVLENGSKYTLHEREDHDGRVDLPPAIGNMYLPSASDDGRWIAVTSNDSILHVYDLIEGRMLDVPLATKEVRARPAIDPEGRFVSYGGAVYAIDSGELLFALDPSFAIGEASACLADGSVLIAGEDLEAAREGETPFTLWRWRPGEGQADVVGVTDWIEAGDSRPAWWFRVEAHPSADACFVAHSDHRITRVDLEPFAETWDLTLDGVIMDMALDADAGELYVVATDGLVHVIDPEAGIELESRGWRAGPRNTPRAALNSITSGPMPGLVTTGTVDCRVEVWEAATGRRVGALSSSPDSYLRHVTSLGDTGWIVGAGGFGRLVLFGSGPNPASTLDGFEGADLASVLDRAEEWLVAGEGDEWIQRTVRDVLGAVARSSRFKSNDWLDARRAVIESLMGD